MRYLEISLEEALKVTLMITSAPSMANDLFEGSYYEDMVPEDQRAHPPT